MRKTVLIVGTLVALSLGSSAAWTAPSKTAIAVAKANISAETMTAMTDAMGPIVRRQILAAFAADPLGEEAEKVFMSIFLGKFSLQFVSNFLLDVAELYDAEFSAEELTEIAAFYATPAGKAMLEKSPLIRAQSGRIGQAVGEAVSERSYRDMRTAVAERGASLFRDPDDLARVQKFLGLAP